MIVIFPFKALIVFHSSLLAITSSPRVGSSKNNTFGFDIKEGDTIMVVGDKARGIAIMKADKVYEMIEGIKNGSNQNQ